MKTKTFRSTNNELIIETIDYINYDNYIEIYHAYILIHNPDIFGFICELDNNIFIRLIYQRMLMNLETKYKEYKTSFTTDNSGERIYVLSKLTSTEETLDNLKELRAELDKD